MPGPNEDMNGLSSTKFSLKAYYCLLINNDILKCWILFYWRNDFASIKLLNLVKLKTIGIY